jgi:probable rRNA maturation factor
MLRIDICNEHGFPLDEARLKKAVRSVLQDAGYNNGEISIAIVGGAEMLALNRKYLNHDYPTDVLSFVLDEEDGRLDGEIIASSDYALIEAEIYNWTAEDEILLYVIHGSLHLVGHDDQDAVSKKLMREQERKYLLSFGLVPSYDEKDVS